MDIGNTIKEQRKRRNIQQQELAERSGISQTYLSQIEGGSRVPTIEILEKISEVLNIPFPVLSFLSLDENTVQKHKREAYKQIAPSINAMIQQFFLQE